MLAGKVDFVIAGAQKGGTTALDAHLRDHPGVCMADVKEVHFFDDEERFRNRRADYAAYHAHFRSCTDRCRVGETTPVYMYWEPAPRRLWEYNPDMKIIMVLRNPIERAYSHWNMQRSRNKDELPFWEAIQREPDRCRQSLPDQSRLYSYVDRGFYTEQLRRIWRFFPARQTLVMKSEDLRDSTGPMLDAVHRFLGVQPRPPAAPSAANAGEYESAMGQREKDHLRQVFEHEIRSLERMLGWDCSAWLSA